ncbi:hypothetical protein [Spirillospora sp. NPDC047279]|uniref:hypothetical protein n=1 Tax=Spirillospora sp. NPDC047279 TaxID=3155478 RepID=UPI0033D40F6D
MYRPPGQAGAAVPVRPPHAAVDRTHPLPETVAALDHIEAGHARGKVVITLENR